MELVINGVSIKFLVQKQSNLPIGAELIPQKGYPSQKVRCFREIPQISSSYSLLCFEWKKFII
jgi:hypothetical protein